MRKVFKGMRHISPMDFLITAKSANGATLQFVIEADNENTAIERANTELRCCNLSRWTAIKAIEAKP
jgi:hypothetical protein